MEELNIKRGKLLDLYGGPDGIREIWIGREQDKLFTRVGRELCAHRRPGLKPTKTEAAWIGALRRAVDERDRLIGERDGIIRRQANDLAHQRSEIAFLLEQLDVERMRVRYLQEGGE